MDKKILAVNSQHLDLENSGGAGRYGKKLYEYLSSTEKYLDFNIFYLNINHSALKNAKDIFSGSNKLDQYFFHLKKIFEKKEEQYFLGKENLFLIKKEHVILLHEITNYDTINEIGRFCLCKKKKLLVTFLDIQDFFYPEYFTDRQLSRRRLLYSLYKDRADYFFAISNFTKQTMIEHLDIPSEKIIVTHLSADDLVLIEPSNRVKKYIAFLGRYWIYPAKIWPHKNHIFLFQTLGNLRDILYQKKIKLVLTGGFTSKDISFLKKKIQENNLGDIVHILGFVSDCQLQSLIKGAEYLIFPSLFEGFGMPILEAMTIGCPVISSNAGSLPEVGGDAALYFDPKDKEQFHALLESVVLEKEIDRNLMIQKGFRNSKRFDWDVTLKKTVNIYKEFFQ